MNLLSFFQIRVGMFQARQPEFEKRKVWVVVGFTQGGGRPPSSDYGVASGGLALGCYHAALPGVLPSRRDGEVNQGPPEQGATQRICSSPEPDATHFRVDVVLGRCYPG
jgi:hypothetical protein